MFAEKSLLTFLSICFFTAAQSIAQVQFTPHTIIGGELAPLYPTSVFAVDINGDGNVDVLSASSHDDKIAWYENDGSEGFTFHIITTNADEALSVYAEDVDSDGDMDVLSASRSDNKIAWYENDGNGNFNTHIISTSAEDAESVYARDIDDDGDMDVFSASYEDGKVAWYENDGNENFTSQIITMSVFGAVSVYAEDVDGDGDLDVLSGSIYGTADKEVAWYENDGNENFTIHIISTNANGVQSVYAEDVDGDGDMDVLSASPIDNEIAWYENDGNENFGIHIISTNAEGAESVYAKDIDDDGDMDVLSASSEDNKIIWYENDGNESFAIHNISTNANGAQSVYAKDIDDDGDMDVLSASRGDNKIAWYENDGNENFTPYPITISVAGVESISFGDVNGDGEMDILSASSGDNKIAWFENDGNEIFTIHEIATNVDGANSVDISDVDSDGDFDVLSTSSVYVEPNEVGEVAWHENDGNENFTTHTIFTTNADGLESVDAADLDNDGDMDVISAPVPSNINKVVWFENDGNENFVSNIIPSIWNPSLVFARDIDNDGDVDIFSSSEHRCSSEIAWIENDGNGNFSLNIITTSTRLLQAVVPSFKLMDIDGDSAIDILLANNDCSSDSSEIVWLENDGGGNFLPHSIITIGTDFFYGVESIDATDIDNDGDIDVVSVYSDYEYWFTKLAWHENDGNENFTTHIITTNPVSYGQSILAVDVDSDGDMDILSASSEDSKIAWYENLTITAIGQDDKARLDKFSLYQNYPNPFNPVTTIKYTLRRSSQVKLSVYDINGKLIKSIVNAFKPAGEHSVIWDGKSTHNEPVSSGVYFYSIVTDDKGSISKKMLLIR